jgi:hypothetical protein
MDGTCDHNAKWGKPSSKSQISCFYLFVETRPKLMMMMVIIMKHDC